MPLDMVFLPRGGLNPEGTGSNILSISYDWMCLYLALGWLLCKLDRNGRFDTGQ